MHSQTRCARFFDQCSQTAAVAVDICLFGDIRPVWVEVLAAGRLVSKL